MSQNETQQAARDAELRRVYAVEWYSDFSGMSFSLPGTTPPAGRLIELPFPRRLQRGGA